MKRLPNTSFSVTMKKEAIDLYQTGLSTRKVAAALAARYGDAPCDSTVQAWMHEEGVIRSPSEAQSLRKSREHERNYNRLRRRALHLYQNEYLSTAEVGEILDVADNTVWRWCEEAGVIRERSDAIRLKAVPREVRGSHEDYIEGQEHAREALAKNHDPALLIKEHAGDHPYWRGWNSVIRQALRQAA